MLLGVSYPLPDSVRGPRECLRRRGWLPACPHVENILGEAAAAGREAPKSYLLLSIR